MANYPMMTGFGQNPWSVPQFANGGVPMGPTGLTKLLQTPGISDALMAAGARLLASKHQPGGLSSGLAAAVPAGVQAYQQGQQRSALNDVLQKAPPEMQKLIRALPMGQRAMAAYQMMTQPAPKPISVPQNTKLVDPTTYKTLADNPAAPSVHYEDLANGQVGVFQGGQLVGQYGPQEQANPNASDYQIVTDASTGEQYRVNKLTGEKQPLGITGPTNAESGGPTTEQKVALQSLNQSVKKLDDITKSVPWIDFMKGEMEGGNFYTSTEYQQLVATTDWIAHNIVIGQGRRYSTERKDDVRKDITPQPGDKPATVEAKMKALKDYLKSLNTEMAAPDVTLSGSADVKPDHLGLR